MSSSEHHGQTDVVIEVDGVKFFCQRNELAKQSPYFEAMFGNNFLEKHKDIIKIQGVDAAAMRFILQWINDTSQIDSLRGEEVLVVLQAAAMLQFDHLQRACEEVMVQRWLCPESCLLTAATADQLSLTKLYQKASALALWHFCEVRHTQAFLDLPSDALVQYLSNNALSLGPSEDEFQVFEGVSCWLEHKMLERCSETLTVLSCVRMNFIPVSDIQSMLNYTCVDSCKDAELLLKCIILIKEGKKISFAEEEAVSTVEDPVNGVDDNNGCCDTLKKIADHMKVCGSELPAEVGCVVSQDERPPYMLELNEADNVSAEKFTTDVFLKAQSILRLTKRELPNVACIIGRVMKTERNPSSDEESNVMDSGHCEKNKKEKTKSGAPHIFYWNSCESDRPVPLLALTKINQGPTEALGYTVVSSGQELFVIGGEYLLGYGNWNKSMWKYNVWSETWTFETSLSIPRRHHSVVCVGDDLYLIGGFGKFRVIMDSVDRYNFSSKTWYKCAPLPSSVYSAATCVHNNIIYVISCQVFCYYPSNNCWVTLSDVSIPTGSSFNTAMPYDGQIFLTGFYSSDLMTFEPFGEKSIKRIGTFQNPAGETCLVGDKIYSFTENDERPCVEVYDIKSDSFQVVWEENSSEGKISFKKSGGCFPLVMYNTLWNNSKGS